MQIAPVRMKEAANKARQGRQDGVNLFPFSIFRLTTGTPIFG